MLAAIGDPCNVLNPGSPLELIVPLLRMQHCFIRLAGLLALIPLFCNGGVELLSHGGIAPAKFHQFRAIPQLQSRQERAVSGLRLCAGDGKRI